MEGGEDAPVAAARSVFALLPPVCVVTLSECLCASPGSEGSSHVVLLFRLGRAHLSGCVGACACVCRRSQVRCELAGCSGRFDWRCSPLSGGVEFFLLLLFPVPSAARVSSLPSAFRSCLRRSQQASLVLLIPTLLPQQPLEKSWSLSRVSAAFQK